VPQNVFDYRPSEQDYRIWLVLNPAVWLMPILFAVLVVALAVHLYAFSLPGNAWESSKAAPGVERAQEAVPVEAPAPVEAAAPAEAAPAEAAPAEAAPAEAAPAEAAPPAGSPLQPIPVEVVPTPEAA